MRDAEQNGRLKWFGQKMFASRIETEIGPQILPSLLVLQGPIISFISFPSTVHLQRERERERARERQR